MIGKTVIGGEFAINEPQIDNDQIGSVMVAPPYSLGRTCLYLILDNIIKSCPDQGRVLIPDYICYSVAEVPKRLGLEIYHYHINEDLLPDLNSIIDKIKKCSAIILVNYFGVTELEPVISTIRSRCNSVRIIIDDVQNFYGFGKSTDVDYSFTSYRKWFAVPDGADISCKDSVIFENVCNCGSPPYAEYKAAGNLLKNHSSLIGDEISLELIEKGERMMEEYAFKCSSITCNLIRTIDFRDAKFKRRKNAEILHKRLSEFGIRHHYMDNCVPLHVPIILKPEIRDKVRKKMFDDNIFCPVHWPLIDRKLQGYNTLYDTELSLVCDQRYDKDDMERLLGVLENGL